ncbi:MAG: PEPxxWA-CTERM sorting domain-containing protein, partial [Croceibacterium sp.]
TSITSGNAVASMAYGLFMQGSTNCTTASPDAPYACNGSGSPAIGPGAVAYIGLSDLPFTSGDHDFQDLGVKVTAIPEPATWAMMLLGIGCVGGVLRSQRRRQALSPA